MSIETNIYKIQNLSEIKTSYKTYKIIGLYPEHPEYFQNRQVLIRKMSYRLRHPVTVIERNGKPYLIVMDGAGFPPSPFNLIRTVVNFELDTENSFVDYDYREPVNDEICLRFLQFLVQEPLHSNINLWQPGAGRPFFSKTPQSIQSNDVNLFSGFSVRATKTPEGGLGFCVDLTSRFVSKRSLPSHITRNESFKWNKKRCVYHYGHSWYEIQVSGMDDRTALNYLIPIDGDYVNLIKYITEQSRKPIPPELTKINQDCSVVTYITNQGETRAAPTELCYPIYGTEDPVVRKLHRSTILSPSNRQDKISEFKNNYLNDLRFGNVKVVLHQEPSTASRKIFSIPDYQFADSKKLSVRGTPNAVHVSLDNLGAERKALLKDAGVYVADDLDRQYFVIPESIKQSFGEQLLSDLIKVTNSFLHRNKGYKPIVISYNDWVDKTPHSQGLEIIKAIKEGYQGPGYGLVMIHHVDKRKIREEDQLAALVIRELRKDDIQIYAAVMHSVMGGECYELATAKDGSPFYRPRSDKRGRLNGYLENVALNKILLTNERWPFVLATRLNADVVIGIDVKQNTAGIIVVSKNGSEISTKIKTTKQKERLLESHIKAFLVEVLIRELEKGGSEIKNIVIHRDGRVFSTEITGAISAINMLKEQGRLSNDVSLTILEIPKSSPAPLRLFDISTKENQRQVDNPQIGSYYVIDERNGYLCTTGRAFPHPGTVKPLHVKKAYGDLDIETCLEDVFYLSSLTWTRPEDCSRHPITMKLNDRYLGEDATDYDQEGFEIEIDMLEETVDE